MCLQFSVAGPWARGMKVCDVKIPWPRSLFHLRGEEGDEVVGSDTFYTGPLSP